MATKPRECDGCPFFGNGRDFVPDAAPKGVELWVMEDVPPENFRGVDAGDAVANGWWKRTCLAATQVDPVKVGYAHLLRCKAARGAKGAKASQAKLHCRVHDQFGDDAVVVTTGQKAWEYMAGTVDGGRGEWFGYYVEKAAQVPGERDDSGLEDLFGGKV